MEIQPFSATSTTAPIGVWGQKTATGVFDKWRGTNYMETQRFKTGLHNGVQYTQSDPVGLLKMGGGIRNLFAYAEGNPAYFSDPLGLDAITEDPNILACFFCMLKKKGYGRNISEIGTWVIDLSKTGGEGYSCHTEGWTEKYRKATWPAGQPFPAGIIGISHTHPTRANGPHRSEPEPSVGDMATADKLKWPIYTVTMEGIYKYDPVTGQITLENKKGWHKQFKKCKPNCKDILQ